MIQLRVETCELTYEGAFKKPVFSLIYSSGKVCDLLIEALEAFGCTSTDLVIEDGQPGERRVTYEIDELDARVSLYGDRTEIHCANFVTGTEASFGRMLESIWSGLAGPNARAVAKTHSFLFEADLRIRGASYQQLLNPLALAPASLPGGTETAVVYYLPREPGRGFGESSLVLNRSAGIRGGLEVNATLVYEAESVKPGATISVAKNRLVELLRNLGLEWIED